MMTTPEDRTLAALAANEALLFQNERLFGALTTTTTGLHAAVAYMRRAPHLAGCGASPGDSVSFARNACAGSCTCGLRSALIAVETGRDAVEKLIERVRSDLGR